MQKQIGVALIALVTAMSAGVAGATSYTFDFEDGVDQRSSERIFNPSLDAYMSRVAGRTVDAGDARWFGSSNTFKSDAIFTRGYSSTLDFDISSARASDFEITSVSFDWGIFDATSGRDFGLDVYDDAIGEYRTNIFEIRSASDGDTGVSGRITFDASWEVTRLRFHDSNTYDVGMDNLTVWDNRTGPPTAPMPEPTAAALFGVGLLVAGTATRRRSA